MCVMIHIARSRTHLSSGARGGSRSRGVMYIRCICLCIYMALYMYKEYK